MKKVSMKMVVIDVKRMCARVDAGMKQVRADYMKEAHRLIKKHGHVAVISMMAAETVKAMKGTR